MDKLIEWLMDGWINRSMDGSIIWSTNRWIDGLIDRSIDGLTDGSIDRSMYWLMDWWIDGSIDVCAFLSSSFSLFSDTNLSPKFSSSFSGAFYVIASVALDLLMFPLDDESKKETKRSSGRKGESKSSATVVPSYGGTYSNRSPPISNTTSSPPRHIILQYAEVEEERFMTLARINGWMDGWINWSMHWSMDR